MVASLLLLGSLVVFYGTPLLSWALTTQIGQLLMVVHFSLVGYAFVWSFVGTDGSHTWSPPMLVVVLGATLAGQAFLALALKQTGSLLAPDFYQAIEVPWASDRLADQQLGGMMAVGIGYLTVILLMLMAVLNRHPRRPSLQPASRSLTGEYATRFARELRNRSEKHRGRR